MKRIARTMSGALAGAALLTFGFAVTPAAANPKPWCSETESYVCCCTENPDGTIQSCVCNPKT